MTPEREAVIRRCWDDARSRALDQAVFRQSEYFVCAYHHGLPFRFGEAIPPRDADQKPQVETISFELHWHVPLVPGRIPYLRVSCEGEDVEIVPLPEKVSDYRHQGPPDGPYPRYRGVPAYG